MFWIGHRSIVHRRRTPNPARIIPLNWPQVSGHYNRPIVMRRNQPFSQRNRYSSAKEITIREEASENLRYFVLKSARDLGWQPSSLRSVLCRALRVRPDQATGANIQTSTAKFKS